MQRTLAHPGQALHRLQYKMLSTLLLWVVYALAFTLLAPLLKSPTGSLVMIPVIFGGWLWGMRVGGLLAFAGGLLNFGLYAPTGLFENQLWIVFFPNLVVLGVGLLVGHLRDLHQTLRQKNELISYHADHDALTGLRNRSSFGREVNVWLEAANLEDNLLGLLYIDLDSFKRVNDRLGHAAGDALLVAVGERLRTVTCSSDVQARLGGDEFAVLLTKLNHAEEAEKVAKNVLVALSDPCLLEGESVAMGASIGISLFPQSGRTLDDLL